MDIKNRKHFKQRGLSNKEINMLGVCLGQCTGCLMSGDCNIQKVLLRNDSPTRETLKQ